jgi:hypothetical protein
VKDAKVSAAEWANLERHFTHHACLLRRFRAATPSAVAGMWLAQTNELGQPLSETERDALIERYCELFGRWPT